MQEPEPLGLRERKLRETRHALESATVDLVLELGLERVTIEQITERADLSPRTFFNHFASKEDALLGVPLKGTNDELLAGFPLQPSGAGVYEDLKSFLIRSFGKRLASDDLLKKRMRAVSDNPQLAKRQMAQVHVLLDGLTARVAALLASEARPPKREPSPAMISEAQMLIRLCAAAFMQAFDPRLLSDPAADGFGALPHAFDLLEHTASKHLTAPTP